MAIAFIVAICDYKLMRSPHPQPHIRATLLANALCEDDAICHQHIADDLADLVTTAGARWRRSPAAFMAADPDPGLVFASIADVLADLFSGLSSGHLQALYAAGSPAQ